MVDAIQDFNVVGTAAHSAVGAVGLSPVSSSSSASSCSSSSYAVPNATTTQVTTQATTTAATTSNTHLLPVHLLNMAIRVTITITTASRMVLRSHRMRM